MKSAFLALVNALKQQPVPSDKETNLNQLIPIFYLLNNLLTIIFKLRITNKDLLHQLIPRRIKFPDRHGHILVLTSRVRGIPAMHLYVMRADFCLQLADAVLFLFYCHAEREDLVLDLLRFASVLTFLLFELLHQMDDLLFYIIHHDLLLFPHIKDLIRIMKFFHMLDNHTSVLPDGLGLLLELFKLFLYSIFLLFHAGFELGFVLQQFYADF